MDRIVFVGSAPGNHPPDKSPTIRRITKWMDELGVDRFKWKWTNLFLTKTTRTKLEGIETQEFMERLKGYGKIIALGNIPSDQMKKLGIQHLKVPHPSGLNRMWNDPELEPKVINDIKGYLQT